MAQFKDFRIESNDFQLKKAWARIPFAVDQKALWQEFKNTQNPTYPPTTFDQADTLVVQFMGWLNSAKGYDVYLETTVYI